MNIWARLLPHGARCLAAVVLALHLAWLPVHLLTASHCDTGPTESHAAAHADHHGHAHDAAAAGAHDHDGDPDHHHRASDHESKFHAKRQVLLLALVPVVWQRLVPPPPAVAALPTAVRADRAPLPADFLPPSGPRAPPTA